MTAHSTRRSHGAAFRATLAALGCTAALTIGGCPAQLEDRERFLACGDVPQTIFAQQCISAGCHNAIDLGGNLDLESPDVASRVAFVPSPNCEGELLADPRAPNSSLIYKKTARTTSCGDPMPLDEEPLSPRQLWCIREWITTVGVQPDAAAEASGDGAGADAEAGGDASPDSD